MNRLQHYLGRTYWIANVLVRVSSIDERCVRFVSAERGVRLINATVTHAEFFRLDLEEAL